MIPATVIRKLENVKNDYSEKGFNTSMKHEPNSNKYEISISAQGKRVVVRDGIYDGEIDDNKVELTSFDVIFQVDSEKFLNIVSDYPLSEYDQRLEEVCNVIDEFFDGNFTISNDRYFLFWKKKYLNIKSGDVTDHFIQVR